LRAKSLRADSNLNESANFYTRVNFKIFVVAIQQFQGRARRRGQRSLLVPAEMATDLDSFNVQLTSTANDGQSISLRLLTMNCW